MYNWKPKNAVVDPDDPRAWASADCCGFIWPLDQLQWQYAYQGSQSPQNTRFLVCPKHIDPLNEQDRPIILPPDPEPVLNARPYPYALEESSYLKTEDGLIITTQSGIDLVTPLPNPDSAANTSYLYCAIVAPGAIVTVAYLDLFDGNPTAGGRSVLAAITGSAVRSNISGNLSLTNNGALYVNADLISIAAAAGSQTNVGFLGLYSASISGSLLYSGRVSVSQTIAQGNAVSFAGLGLSISVG